MRTKLKGRFSLLFLSLAVLLAVPAIALADTLTIDGDVLDAGNSKNTTFTLCPGDGGSVDQKVTVEYSGSDHFATGATVTITASVEAAAQNFITATGGSVVTGSSGSGGNPWNNNQDKVSTGLLPLTVDTDWEAGTYKVTYTATGQKAGATAGTNLVISDFSNVKIEEATTGCAAPNEAPLVNVVGPEDSAIYEINDVPAATCSVDDEDAGASANPVVGDVTGPLSAYGLGTQTVTCSYKDSGGESGTDEVTYTIQDTGNPTITDLGPTPASPDGLNGWYTSQVTNTFQAQDFNGTLPTPDDGAGFATTTPPLLQYNIEVKSGANQEGNVANPVVLSSGSVSDVAGNTAASVDSANFKIDLFNPTVNITNAPAQGAKFDICSGALPSPGFTANDTALGSGVNTSSSSGGFTTQPNTATGAGDYTYQAQATDFAGRQGSASRSYSVVYDTNYSDTSGAFSGVLQPVNLGAQRSAFKVGATIPVKFTLSCNGTPINNAVAKLYLSKIDNSGSAVNEAVSTNSPDIGNKFRVTDLTTGQYQFNLSTKAGYVFTNPDSSTVSLGEGTWYMYILLDDSPTKVKLAEFDLKK